MSNIVFVFFQRFTQQSEVQALIKRLDTYSKVLYGEHQKKLTVVFFKKLPANCGDFSSSTLRVNCLDLKSIKIFRALRLFSSHSGDTRFVAGSLWRDFPILLLLKLFKLGKVWIQISIHGPLTSRNSSALSNLLKRFISFFFRFSNSVRFVSESLENHYSYRLKLKPERVFVSPIPTQLFDLHQDSTSRKALCYLGRIHHERDYAMWAKIASMVHENLTAAQFQIIGSGTDSIEFSRLLSRNIPVNSLEFRGFVAQEDLAPEFENFHILLSTAREEGYGLAIREAGLQNKYVVARRNSGTIPLARTYPSTYLLFNTESEAVEIILRIWNLEKDFKECYKIREDLIVSNQRAILTLIDSWIK